MRMTKWATNYVLHLTANVAYGAGDYERGDALTNAALLP